MKFFVTGGAGFIGSALVKHLLQREHRVVVYDDFLRGKPEFLPAHPNLQVVRGDVRDREHVATALQAAAPDHVVHLAALHFIPDCIKRPADTIEINVGGTENVLACCAEQHVQSVLFASSAAVYTPSDAACDEALSALGPTEVYGESKLLGERLCQEHHARTGLATTSLRIFNAIGPRETNPHVVPHIFESLRGSDSIDLGNVEPKRDYVNTRDIAAAILAIAERAQGYRVFNVGSGVAHSVTEIVARIGEQLGRPLEIKVDPARLRSVDRPLLLAATAKLTREVGFTAEVGFEESLAELIADYGLRGRNRDAAGVRP